MFLLVSNLRFNFWRWPLKRTPRRFSFAPFGTGRPSSWGAATWAATNWTLWSESPFTFGQTVQFHKENIAHLRTYLFLCPVVP